MSRRLLFTSRGRGFGRPGGFGAPELRNLERELFLFKRRLGLASAIVLLAFAGLAGRFAWLQIAQHSHYQTLAETNRIAIVPIAPNRGVVTDRNGIVLAQSFSAYTLEVQPSRVKNLDAMIDALSDVVEIAPRDRKRFRKLLEESKNFESLPLRTRLSDEEVARFAVNRYRFPGVEQVEVDAAGRAVRTLSRTPPTSGNNLRLSLDIKLQQVAEKAFGDRRGALVAIDPTTGDVLAFVSKPGYDPNLFVEGIDPANWQELNESPDKPLLNRPLRGAYPPGSTIKPFLALGALTSGKRTATQAISDPGYYQLPGQAHRFRDDKPGGHGMVDMYKSIVVSCDTYYYQLANDTDIDDTARFLGTLGFGQKTGIDIEGELTGTLPSREWKRTRFAGPRYRDEHRKWYLGDSISAGIGQGYNAFTPIQLAHAIATIANEGVMFRPHLVKSITAVDTSEVRAIARDSIGTLAVTPEHMAVIRAALVGVNKEGTSARAFTGAAYTSGGKTGTAQVYSLKGEKYTESKVDERLRDHAWFIAYAPADKPRIALSVLVENGGFGAQAAAPIARRVLDYFITGETRDGGVALPGAVPGDDESD